MNIIFDSPEVDRLRNRHVVLELDTFILPNVPKPVKSFCVLENIPITEINTMDHYIKLHQDLIQHYHSAKWNVCVDAICLLRGRWGGELDSFYLNLQDRINKLSTAEIPLNWSGFINKSGQPTQSA